MKKFIFIALVFCMNFSLGFSQAKELKIGDIAPEIKLSDPKGKTIALSTFRNKIVLIDFWASWCAPCVNEQPHLAELYKKYKNAKFTNGKGFEIYAVSLDNKKKAWQSIINKYKIDWTQVSDLQFWGSPVAKLYNIEELPSNFLIDGNGKIIAKNLHGGDLEKAIKKLMLKSK